MNNRKVFQAFTQARAGINTNKCLALITAAYDGNTEEAIRLASDPQVDINFLAYFPKDQEEYVKDNEYHSALSAALIKNHSQIVLFYCNKAQMRMYQPRYTIIHTVAFIQHYLLHVYLVFHLI